MNIVSSPCGLGFVRVAVGVVRTGVNLPQCGQRQELNVSALVLDREKEDKNTPGS